MWKALVGTDLGAWSWIIPRFFPQSRVLPKAPPWSFKSSLKNTLRSMHYRNPSKSKTCHLFKIIGDILKLIIKCKTFANSDTSVTFSETRTNYCSPLFSMIENA